MFEQDVIQESTELAESLRCFLHDYYREELRDNSGINPICSVAALMSVLMTVSDLAGVPKDILRETFIQTLEKTNYGQEN